MVINSKCVRRPKKQDGGIISIITQNRYFSPKLYKCGELFMPNKLSNGTNLIGPSVCDLERPKVLVTWYLTFSEYGHVGTHFEGLFELNIMFISKILFMTLFSIFKFHSSAHINTGCGDWISRRKS